MSGAVSLGGRIYTFGGYSRGTSVADAFRYDPQTNGWSAIAPLPRALLGVGAVTDGRYIYLVNGSDAYQRALATLYRYDPQNDSYATLASPRQPTFRHALAILNSKIYRIGGDTGQGATAGVEVFDIATALGHSRPATRRQEGVRCGRFQRLYLHGGRRYGGREDIPLRPGSGRMG